MSDHISALLPEGNAGKLIAGFLASTLLSAHAAAPSGWGLTSRSKLVRLNVGSAEALSLASGELNICVLRSTLPAEILRHPSLYLHEPDDGPDADVYPSVHGSQLLVVDNLGLRGLRALLERVQQSHLGYVGRAALTNPNPMTKKSHTPSAVDELASLTARSLPQPRYAAQPAAVGSRTA